MSACVHVSVREREIKRARFQKCALPATVITFHTLTL